MDHTQTTLLDLVRVQPHRPSKQIPSSCWLLLIWEASRLTRINSIHVELFSGENHVATV